MKKPKINTKLVLVLLSLALIGASFFYVQLSKELDSLKSPHNISQPSEALTSDQSSPEDPKKTNAQNIKKDPFKEFLESKARNPQASINPAPDPSFVPGTDPFKAKLEEQKNAVHSAVSPFKN